MEQKSIIIILIAIIIILAACIGMVVLHPFESKEPSKIMITSNQTIYEGDGLSIELTDLNNTPISNEFLNITIYDSKNNVVIDEAVKTNSEGKAKLDLDLNKGEYTVNVTFDGNKNFSTNTTSKNIKIIEKEIVETTPEEPTSTSQTTETTSSSQDTSQSDGLVNWDGDPSHLPYPIRAEDDRNGIRM